MNTIIILDRRSDVNEFSVFSHFFYYVSKKSNPVQPGVRAPDFYLFFSSVQNNGLQPIVPISFLCVLAAEFTLSAVEWAIDFLISGVRAWTPSI